MLIHTFEEICLSVSPHHGRIQVAGKILHELRYTLGLPMNLVDKYIHVTALETNTKDMLVIVMPRNHVDVKFTNGSFY